MCTATQQKNGPGSEEAEKPDQNTAEKALLEEKSQLETQLKDMTVSLERKEVTMKKMLTYRSQHEPVMFTIFIREVSRIVLTLTGEVQTCAG